MVDWGRYQRSLFACHARVRVCQQRPSRRLSRFDARYDRFAKRLPSRRPLGSRRADRRRLGREQGRRWSAGQELRAGNRYLTADDLKKIDATSGGKYVIAQRTLASPGCRSASRRRNRVQRKQRLFGYFGVKGGHLPFQTAMASTIRSPAWAAVASPMWPKCIRKRMSKRSEAGRDGYRRG